MYIKIENQRIINWSDTFFNGAIQVSISREEIEKHIGYNFNVENGKFSENEEVLKNQKEKIISEYKEKMQEIQKTQSELDIAILGLSDEDESIVGMSEIRKNVLEKRLTEQKQELKAIAQIGVSEFGTEIISEF